ncbi:hypothetical protein MNBD_GAMMA15-1771 [hydrothermal vent metagenome]|uniref:ATPase AAA-type core domain-containing protein n=1 Tax=hydrothermal vent metagenome TaxID=652676 RepID=A0A3B0YNK2_9ZZZZ
MKGKPRLIKLDGRPLSTLLGAKSFSAGAESGTVVYSENKLAHELSHVIQQSGQSGNSKVKIIPKNQMQNPNNREKLDHIFRTAKANNNVLIFDEADALFGQRSEVRNSRDRYANIETNYLLEAAAKYQVCVYAVLDKKSGRR